MTKRLADISTVTIAQDRFDELLAAEAFAVATRQRQVTPLRSGGFPSDAWRRADDEVERTRKAWLALRAEF